MPGAPKTKLLGVKLFAIFEQRIVQDTSITKMKIWAKTWRKSVVAYRAKIHCINTKCYLQDLSAVFTVVGSKAGLEWFSTLDLALWREIYSKEERWLDKKH